MNINPEGLDPRSPVQSTNGLGKDAPYRVVGEQTPTYPDTCKIKVSRVFVDGHWCWLVEDGEHAGMSDGLLEAIRLYRAGKEAT